MLLTRNCETVDTCWRSEPKDFEPSQQVDTAAFHTEFGVVLVVGGSGGLHISVVYAVL